MFFNSEHKSDRQVCIIANGFHVPVFNVSAMTWFWRTQHPQHRFPLTHLLFHLEQYITLPSKQTLFRPDIGLFKERFKESLSSV
jgi:hypothetical protein